MKKIFISVLFFISFNHIIIAQSGELDPSFGNKGIIKTDLGSPYNYNYDNQQVLYQPDGSLFFILEVDGQVLIIKRHANGSAAVDYGKNGASVSLPMYLRHAAQQPDGKIIIAGFTVDLSYGNFPFPPIRIEIVRFNIDGNLDSTFGVNGIKIAGFNYYSSVSTMALQSDGKIVIAGAVASANPPKSMSMARFNGDGTLDTSFGSGGHQTYEENQTFGTNGGDIGAIAIQTDGKIIVGGSKFFRCNSNGSFDSTFNGNGGNFVEIRDIAIQNGGKIIIRGGSGFSLSRFNNNGSFDSSFGVSGLAKYDFGGSNDIAYSMAIQSDDKIVFIGKAGLDSNSNFAILRFNQNGTIDEKQITPIGPISFARSLTMQNDGKLISFGLSLDGNTYNFAAARYNINISLDLSFGVNGILVDKFFQGSTFYTCTAIQTDGKILAAGYTWNGINYDFALVRYNKDGSNDITFSGDGIQVTDFSGSDDRANGIAIQKDGKIILAGSAGDKFGIARYNKDGSADITFDGNGLQTTSFQTKDYATSISIQIDGKIVVAGSGLARFNIDGSPDLTFGTNGKLSTPFTCNNVRIQDDGKIIILGYNIFTSIARFNTYGKPDSTFGVNGIRLLEIYHSTNPLFHGNSLGFQNDGKIVIGGDFKYNAKGGNTSQFALVRLNLDGSDDNTFFTGWPVQSSVNSKDYAMSLLIQGDNKILLGGYFENGNNEDFAITRYNADGSLDNTFSGDGKQTTQVSLANDRIAALAILEDKLYAVGFGNFPGTLGVVARYLLGPLSGPLPVTIANFTATVKDKSVHLQWQSESEVNLSHFIIQRSAASKNFITIGNVKANGNGKNTYNIIDKDPLPGANFYRLKMIDNDQQFSYSNIASANLADDFTYKISPNPARNILYVHVQGLNEIATLQIIDAGGRNIKEVKVSPISTNAITIDIHNLSKGIYNLKLIAKTKMEIRRFIKEN
jgi:uncharacterized delta-60 repeat protein